MHALLSMTTVGLGCYTTNLAFVLFAAYLMEDVYKMTYSDLYLFQKTLQETGQPVLADNVPVETEPIQRQLVNRPPVTI